MSLSLFISNSKTVCNYLEDNPKQSFFSFLEIYAYGTLWENLLFKKGFHTLHDTKGKTQNILLK